MATNEQQGTEQGTGERRRAARRAETADVQRLAKAGAQLVEVLPERSYRSEHLPGATLLPLTEFSRESTARLDRDRPVVVYCYDTECDLSARGAALLAEYGFPEVYDYAESKVAWFSMGLPAEGDVPDGQRAGTLARGAVTCAPRTPLADLPDAGAGGVVVVVDEDGVVLGTVRPERARSAGGTTAIDVAQPAPPTVRPAITAEELAASMDSDGQHHVLVSTLDGKLIGVVLREDLDVDR